MMRETLSAVRVGDIRVPKHRHLIRLWGGVGEKVLVWHSHPKQPSTAEFDPESSLKSMAARMTTTIAKGEFFAVTWVTAFTAMGVPGVHRSCTLATAFEKVARVPPAEQGSGVVKDGMPQR